MIRAFLLLVLLFSQIFARDPLATNQKAREFRTGSIDTSIAEIPVDLQRQVFVSPEDNLSKLTSHLTENAPDDFTKIKRIHDWITDNIAYDSDLLLGLSDEGSRKTYELLKYRRTTCSGFSRLFQEMSQQAGLKTVMITAQGKTMYIPKQKRFVRHVYNAANIEGKWYIIDTTADARMSYKFGKFSEKRKYVDRNLFLHPQAKLIVNLPLDIEHQYGDKLVTEEDFLKIPRVTLGYYGFGFEYDEKTRMQFSEGRKDFEGGYLQKVYDEARSSNKIFTIRFKAEQDVLFYPGLAPAREESVDDNADASNQKLTSEESDKKNLSAYTFCYRDGDVICQFSPPTPGTYKAYIQAKFAGDTGKFSLVHAFTLITEMEGVVLPDIKDEFFTNAMFKKMGMELRKKKLTETSVPYLDFYNPSKAFLTSLLYDADGIQIKNAVEVSYTSDGRRFYYKIPTPGIYSIKIQTRFPDEEGGPRQNLAIIKFDSLAPSGSIPPPNEILFTKRYQDSAITLVSENISTGGVKGIYSINLISSRAIECELKEPISRKVIERGCIYDTNGKGNYTFHFRASDEAEYFATINQLEGESDSQKASVINFRIRESRSQENYQKSDNVFYSNYFFESKCESISLLENHQIQIKCPAGIPLETRLIDAEGKSKNGAKNTTTGSFDKIGFSPAKSGHYLGKIIMKTTTSSHVIATVLIESNKGL